MRRVIFSISVIVAFTMFLSLAVYGQEETVFSGNLRLGYVNMKDTEKVKYEDSFSIHFLELMVKKKVGSFGIFVNERIGDNNANYLYEGWIYYTMPEKLGTIKLGLVPVPFGIYSNGLYYPKGIPFDRNWLWDQDYGISYTGNFQQSDSLGFSLEAAYLNKENAASELGAFNAEGCNECLGERDTLTGRLGLNLGIENLLEAKIGGSGQFGKLVRKNQDEKDDKVGLAGDITITQKIIDMPIVLMGEFINYSLGESDMAKGNIVMAQADITPIQKLGMLDKATLSLHVGMEMPKEGKARTNLIGQLLLQLDKQFLIFAQVFGDKYEDADEMTGQGLRVWFMYLF